MMVSLKAKLKFMGDLNIIENISKELITRPWKCQLWICQNHYKNYVCKSWVFNTYTPKADQKNFRWYLKDSHRFSGSMAPLTPELFLSCCISREKVFRGNGVTFREAGGRVRLCKLPSDAIATLQPHLSRKYAWEKKNFGRDFWSKFIIAVQKG